MLRRAEQCKNQAVPSEGKYFRTLKEGSGQQTADHEMPLLSLNPQPLFDILQNHVKRSNALPKTITFAHEHLCDP